MVLIGKFSQPYSKYPVQARASGGAVYPLFNIKICQFKQKYKKDLSEIYANLR